MLKTEIVAKIDHLDQVIRARHLDVTTTLIRSGSPYSLELQKTNASYEADLKRYKSDLTLLSSLP